MGLNVKLSPIAIILGILFITLKLLGVIEWAWVWVLSPFWILLACSFVIAILAFIIGIIAINLRR